VNATLAITDNCDAAAAVTLVSIVSNEPASGLIGRGDDGPDIQGAAFGTDDRTFALRAERDTGVGITGRVYIVTYRVTDSSGNASEKSATVTVSTNNSGK
jgi:sialidase-1